jgi:16S rRNA (guanine527-N7)-methyltransferase
VDRLPPVSRDQRLHPGQGRLTAPGPESAHLAPACRKLGIELTAETIRLLNRYAALVGEWNERMNIVSAGDTGRILSYHAIDSIAVHRLLPTGARVVDIGSGGGLPGIPLAVVRPDLDMHLVESSRKRGIFLRTTISDLALTRVSLHNDRAESLPPLGCDAAVSRLTGPLLRTLRVAARHVIVGGRIILYKTPACDLELSRAAAVACELGLSPAETIDIALPTCGITRRLVIYGRQA